MPVFRPLDSEVDLPEAERNLNLIGSIGGTNHEGIVNAIMLGLSPDPDKPVVTFSLVYVDPEQFAQEASASSTS